jgi:hypothetical protein
MTSGPHPRALTAEVENATYATSSKDALLGNPRLRNHRLHGPFNIATRKRRVKSSAARDALELVLDAVRNR